MKKATMVYHSYVLNVHGHEASRASTDALCALRAALLSVENPVSDVVLLVAPDNNDNKDLASRVFTEIEKQRPAGVTTAYALVKWPSFRAASSHEASNDVPTQRDAHKRFQKLFSDINHTFEATDFDTAVVESLKAKCESYMKDIERLLVYGKEATTRLSDDLKQIMVELSGAIEGDAVYNRNNILTVDTIDSLHDKLLHKDQSPINPELQTIMNHLETSCTTSGHGGTSVHREAQRNWLVLSFLIGSIVNQALQRRAERVGRVWVHHFIADLMRHSRSTVRFHLIGNQRGCEAVLAATMPCKEGLFSAFDRKLHTLLLTQASCSSRCAVGKSRYERMAGKVKNSPTSGPILATVLGMCAQLRGHGVIGDDSAVGTAGFRGLSPRKVSNILVQIGQVKEKRESKTVMRGGKLYNLHLAGLVASKDSICNTDAVASHSEVIALFWKAAQLKVKTIGDSNTGGGNERDRISKWALFMARWKAIRS